MSIDYIYCSAASSSVLHSIRSCSKKGVVVYICVQKGHEQLTFTVTYRTKMGT